MRAETISQVKENRDWLQSEILRLVQQFNEISDATVCGIELIEVDSNVVGGGKKLVKVKVNVEL